MSKRPKEVRAWHKVWNEMSYSYTMFNAETTVTFTSGNESVTSTDIEWLDYTGLTDKNGNKIYEDDILKISTSNVHGKGVVEFDTLSCCSKYTFGGDDWSEMEVIGNKWENPELL